MEVQEQEKPISNKQYKGIAIELKHPKGSGEVTAEQTQWLDHFRNQGWLVILSNNIFEIVIKLHDYFKSDLPLLEDVKPKPKRQYIKKPKQTTTTIVTDEIEIKLRDHDRTIMMKLLHE